MLLSNAYTKPALSSTAVQGGIGSLALAVALYTQGQYPEAATALVAGVMAVYGRYKATKSIRGVFSS